ncbi:MAG: hypothetical protein ACRETI_10035 [Steroidobacteraceae bacterium]
MTPPVRKFALTVHVTASIGWVGALAVFFTHAVAGLASDDEQIVRAVTLAMGITAWFVILPLALASFATGLIQALGTAWGLVRHYWVLFKLVLTAVATMVLLMKLGPISYLAEAAAKSSFSVSGLIGLRTSVMAHAGGGLLVLLTIATLAVYKPRGLTPHGTRMERERGNAGGSTAIMATGSPRWARIFGAVLVVLILAVAVMSLVGSHGPGAHVPSHG